jgi:hypothetical protein
MDGSGNGPLYLDCIESAYARVANFFSVAQLLGRLRQSHHDILGAVLIISNMSELMGLIQSQELLDDIPIILILPVDDPEMNLLGHVLHPRYLTSFDHSEMEVRNVLVQFVQKLKEQSWSRIYGREKQTENHE